MKLRSPLLSRPHPLVKGDRRADASASRRSIRDLFHGAAPGSDFAEA